MSNLPALQINEEELFKVLHFDSITGVFTWSIDRRNVKAGTVAGTVKKDGYIQIHVLGKSKYAHRLAWLFHYGKHPKYFIDHIDGNPSNNSISNLRDVPSYINQQNQRRHHISNKSSSLLGVSFDKKNNKWHAKISINNKTLNLGRFNFKEDAHDVYVKAKRNLHQGGML